jgi:hypothetical protein
VRTTLLAVVVSLGQALSACARSGEASRPVASAGTSAVAPAECASGSDRHLIRSKCIDSPMLLPAVPGGSCEDCLDFGAAPGGTPSKGIQSREYTYGPPRQAVAVYGTTTPEHQGPRFATAGFRKPTLVDPDCVKRSIRLAPEVAARRPGNITVQFAVDQAGQPGPLHVLTEDFDIRVAQAIALSVQSCRWNAGMDPQGHPASLWVILPIRFGW